jgi:transcription elongation factor Elf1
VASRNITIVVARCSRNSGGFGIRFERSGETRWYATWAFALKETAAKREGYDRSEISGVIQLYPSYPGCPHCANSQIVRCGHCGKVSCWDGETRLVTCPWCGNRAEIAGAITSLTSRNDA